MMFKRKMTFSTQPPNKPEKTKFNNKNNNNNQHKNS